MLLKVQFSRSMLVHILLYAFHRLSLIVHLRSGSKSHAKNAPSKQVKWSNFLRLVGWKQSICKSQCRCFTQPWSEKIKSEYANWNVSSAGSSNCHRCSFLPFCNCTFTGIVCCDTTWKLTASSNQVMPTALAFDGSVRGHINVANQSSSSPEKVVPQLLAWICWKASSGGWKIWGSSTVYWQNQCKSQLSLRGLADCWESSCTRSMDISYRMLYCCNNSRVKFLVASYAPCQDERKSGKRLELAILATSSTTELPLRNKVSSGVGPVKLSCALSLTMLVGILLVCSARHHLQWHYTEWLYTK